MTSPLYGALPACHSDAMQNLRVAKQLGKGEELPELNEIMELRVCATLRLLQPGKMYRAVGLYRS